MKNPFRFSFFLSFFFSFGYPEVWHSINSDRPMVFGTCSYGHIYTGLAYRSFDRGYQPYPFHLWVSLTGDSAASIRHHLLGPPVPPASRAYPPSIKYPTSLFKNMSCVHHDQSITFICKHVNNIYIILMIQSRKSIILPQVPLRIEVKRSASLARWMC